MTKRVIPKVYLCIRDRLHRYSDWQNRVHYKTVKRVLGYMCVPRELRDAVIQEMIHYDLLKQEPLWLIVNGVKKKCIFG